MSQQEILLALVITGNIIVFLITQIRATDLGFYYGAEDGAAFEIEANKAYLALPAAKIPAGAPSMFRIVIEDNNVTNLNNVEVTKQATKFFKNGKLFIKKNGVVYDMMGSTVK